MSRRALVFGLAMAVWVNLWPTYSSLIVRSSRADYAHLSLALLIPFVFLLLVNRRLGSRALSPSELLTIFCSGSVAALMQGEWLSSYFLGTITAPAYFATPENRWADLIVANVAPWAIVSRRDAVSGFYEGLPDSNPFPADAWVGPLFWWGTFFAAVLTCNLCISIILRRQWMENERLPFPIATAVLQLTGVSGTRDTLSTMLRNRYFRIGFWLVFGMTCWNMLSWFLEGFPRLPILHGDLSKHFIPLGQGFPTFRFAISPLTLVFGYFTKSEVLFSIWFFHLLAILQMGFFNRLGYSVGGSDPWGSFDPTIGWQCFGGLIAFVGWGLWVARDHLRAVMRKVLRNEGIDDSEELLPYRSAAVLLAIAAGYGLLFIRATGMDWAPLIAFWFATAVIYLGLARIVIESGLVFMRNPITAQAFTWHLFGVAGLGPVSSTALALTYTFFCDAKSFGMTVFAHLPRLGAAMNRRTRRQLPAVVLAAGFIGAATVIAFTLYQGYHVVGSYNFGVVGFNGSNDGARGIWRLTANRIQQGTFGTDWTRVSFLGVGIAAVTGLFLLRYRFPGFPVHPIGFTISANAITQNIVASCFIIWAVKGLVLQIGGLTRYREYTPFFLGILVGYLGGVAAGLVVDLVFFHGNGHPLITSF